MHSEYETLKVELQEANDSKKDAKDDLLSTRKNYELQLQLLTEHLLSINEKLGRYEEEISRLKACRVLCGKCKTWNTIEWLLAEGKNGQRCTRGNHPSSFNFA